MDSALRKCLATAALATAITGAAAASASFDPAPTPLKWGGVAPEGIRWNHRPAYDCNVRFPHPPAGTICSNGVWVHPVYVLSPW